MNNLQDGGKGWPALSNKTGCFSSSKKTKEQKTTQGIGSVNPIPYASKGSYKRLTIVILMFT